MRKKQLIAKTRDQLRNRDIPATDFSFTGDEPRWENWETWDVKKFFNEVNRSFRFYNYYCAPKDLYKDVIIWMKANGYSKDQWSKVSKTDVPSVVVASAARSLNRGMPAEHPDASSYIEQHPGVGGSVNYSKFVKTEINRWLSLRDAATVKTADSADQPVDASDDSKKSVRELTLDKANREVVAKLDEMLDDWIVAKDDRSNVKRVDLYRLLVENTIAAYAIELPEKWINRQLSELKGAYDKTDDQMVEGYSHLSRVSIRHRIKLLEEMLTDIAKYSASKVKTRKPRKRKEKPVEKRVARVRYQEKCTEMNLVSQSPTKLIGANEIYLYNTKKRFFMILKSKSGFDVKGSTIINGDDMVGKRLRKPEEFIAKFLKETPRKLHKSFDELTTKSFTPNCRMNEHTLILRVC